MKSLRRDYQTRQFMLRNEYEIFYYKDDHLKEVELHHHDFFEVYFFIAGKVTYVIEGRSYVLRAGDILLISPDELHQPIIEENENNYERIVLWINPQFFKVLGSDMTDLSACFDITRETHSNLLRAVSDTSRKVKYDMFRLLNEADCSGFGNDVFYKTCIQQILIELNRFLMSPSYEIDNESIVTNDFIQSVIVYIYENLVSDLTLDGIAGHFYVSKFHLSREFKRHVGTTVYRYILQKRLIMAKQLIIQGIPITDVYFKSGFGDYSNFFRAFKMEYGITPKDFYNLTIR
ncbi:MAG: rhaS [Firmicutes bacterium]|nr:rhaS [Bacillota bacterium]